MVDALFVDPKGPYPQLLGVERCWDEERDARTYAGTGPVIVHPPCQLWGNMARVNYKRYPKEKNRPGNDGGAFKSALMTLIRCGGVLEHPIGSRAFATYGLSDDFERAWKLVGCAETYGRDIWGCMVSQCAYGHLARKRTALLYVGDRPPFELNWTEPPYTHQIGHDGKLKRPKPTLWGKKASLTPMPFALELVRLAGHSRL